MGHACIAFTTDCYDTIAEAVAAASPGAIIEPDPGLHTESLVLDRDVELRSAGTGAVVLRDTLDGRPILDITNGARVTITNLTFAATVGRVFDAAPNTDVTFANVHAYSQSVVQWGALGYADQATITLFGVVFEGGVAEYGGQLVIRDGLLLASGTFSGGHAGDSGGCIALIDGDGVPSEHIVSATFSDCQADGNGGALYVENDSVALVYATFEDCGARDGGALFAVNPRDVSVVNGTFERVRSTAAVAALSDVAPGGALSLREVYFSENLGAAVFASQLDTLDVDGLVQVRSTAEDSAAVGVMANQVGATTVRRGLFCGNDAPLGALISVDLGADQTLAVTNERFAANTAGLALDVLGGGSIELTHNDFLFGSGGAARVDGANAVTFSDNVIDGMDPQGELLWLLAVDLVADANLFWDTPSPPVDGPGAMGFVADPGLQGWDPSRACAAAEDLSAWDVPGAPFADWYGGGRDAGTVGLDRDGSAPDIGAAGGPEASTALWADGDGDGWPGAYDCPLTGDSLVDALFHPNADDHAYDGIDADCDRRSDNDADRDGHDSEAYGGDDCDDESARRHPGAVEVGGNRIDEDCDGSLDGDGDGFEPPDDCDDFDATVYPGLSEDEGSVDRNCDGVADVARPLGKRGCATVPAFPSALLAVALAALTRRKRAHGR